MTIKDILIQLLTFYLTRDILLSVAKIMSNFLWSY